MSLEKLDECVTHIDSIFPSLLSFVQMQQAELLNFIQVPENISKIQNIVFSLQTEFFELKKSLVNHKSHRNETQFELLKEKNQEFLNLQNQLSESEKLFSNARLELAELKRAIAVQEAQNAKLTAENLLLKNDNKIDQLQDRIDQLSNLNSNINGSIEKELKLAQQENEKLRKIITNLKLDLEQTKTVADKYKELNNHQNVTKEIYQLNQKLNEKENEHKKAQAKIQEYQNKIVDIEQSINHKFDKQSKKSNEIIHHISECFQNLIDKFNQKRSQVDQKVESLFTKLFEMKAKIAYLHDMKYENRIYSAQIDDCKQLLEFAMQSMANLAGVSSENMPSSYDVIENGELLNLYLADLQAKILEKTMERASTSMKKKPSPKQQLNTTLTTISDLMNMMTEQMQSEHDELMNQISDDKELPSFRKTVMSSVDHTNYFYE
ncbi:hypothetical protein TRFO_40414 [Tritrichomonas foetus]|uniref:Uncharacterized protein n=1 Tax=Tritrichomonas foetus TaxID=1144522 RepID=A0A1J4J146_9EUKA|nr:hypothetical protein TRFO_40414 [Tritrichomonas foetus]|eukprot:OHS93326.1 hypothetical protein TRFO_40414 [Tritrichomonas foetus]